MRIVAIIQARMGSTRLSGKVLLDLAGAPLLARVVERTRRARRIDDLVVATTDRAEDQAIADLCAARGWRCFRGSEQDLLDRYYHAARAVNAEAILRITADCPLIDPQLIDHLVEEFTAHSADYVCQFIPRRTYPRGLDAEIFTFAVLESLWREETSPASREHVTPNIQHYKDRFRIHGVVHAVDHSAHRWTVDTPEDLELIRNIYDHFRGDNFTWDEALVLLDQHPEWAEINRHVEQKTHRI